MDIKNFYTEKGFVVVKKLIPDEIILNVKNSLEIFKYRIPNLLKELSLYLRVKGIWYKMQPKQ